MRQSWPQSKITRCVSFAHTRLLLLASIILIHDAVFAQYICDQLRSEASLLNSEAKQIGSYSQFRSVTFSPNGNLIVTAGKGPAQIWNAHDGRLIRQIGLVHGTVECIAFTPDGSTITMASSHSGMSLLEGEDSFSFPHDSLHSKVTSWAVETGELIQEFEGERDLITTRVVDPESQSRIKEVRTFAGQREVITSIAYSTDGTTLLSGGQAESSSFNRGFGQLKIWDPRTGKLKVTLDRVEGWFEHAKLSQEDRTVLSVAYRSSVESADPRSLESEFSQDQIQIVTSDVETGATLLRCWWALGPHGFGGIRLILSPSAQIVAAIIGKEIRLYAVSTVQEPRLLSGCSKSLSHAAFSSDGNRIAANSYEGLIYVWDLSSESNLPIEINTEGDPVRGVAFSPDGRTIVACGRRCLRFWNASTGSPVLDDRGHVLTIPRAE